MFLLTGLLFFGDALPKLRAAPFSLSDVELSQIRDCCLPRIDPHEQALRVKEQMEQNSAKRYDMMAALCAQPGPWLVVAVTVEGYIVGGFHTTLWFEREVGSVALGCCHIVLISGCVFAGGN